jgi:hypothetical protein
MGPSSDPTQHPVAHVLDAWPPELDELLDDAVLVDVADEDPPPLLLLVDELLDDELLDVLAEAVLDAVLDALLLEPVPGWHRPYGYAHTMFSPVVLKGPAQTVPGVAEQPLSSVHTTCGATRRKNNGRPLSQK